jgi:hypothetical protein
VDLARGPIPCVSLYTMIWGEVPVDETAQQ